MSTPILARGLYPTNYAYNSKPPRDRFYGTLFGTLDTEHVKNKFNGTMVIPGVVGSALGTYYAILIKGADPTNLRSGNPQFILGKSIKAASYGVAGGAMYYLTMMAASKVRGDKDGPLNHFIGGFGASSVHAYFRSSLRVFLLGGIYYGIAFSLIKHLYMISFPFFNIVDRPELITNCRYPEIYVALVDTSLLKKEEEEKALANR